MQITIHTDRDLTPDGKRAFRVLNLRRGVFIRWYVSGRIYRQMAASRANEVLSQEWVAA
jgi:hypothetical protein